MAGLVRVFMTHTMIQVSSHGVESQELIGCVVIHTMAGIIGHIVFIVEVPPCAFMESGDILIATVMSQYL